MLHEMMHMILWDNEYGIIHSTDETSLLYFSADGNTLFPNENDVIMMHEALTQTYPMVSINLTRVEGYPGLIDKILIAANQWNSWLGCQAFMTVRG